MVTGIRLATWIRGLNLAGYDLNKSGIFLATMETSPERLGDRSKKPG